MAGLSTLKRNCSVKFRIKDFPTAISMLKMNPDDEIHNLSFSENMIPIPADSCHKPRVHEDFPNTVYLYGAHGKLLALAPYPDGLAMVVKEIEL